MPAAPPVVLADKVESSHVPSSGSRAEAAAASEAVQREALGTEALGTEALRVEKRVPLPPSKPSVVGLKQTGLRSFFGAPTV